MAAAISRPAAPNGGPPNIPLPKLPVIRARKSPGALQNPTRLSSPSPSPSIASPRSPGGLRYRESSAGLRESALPAPVATGFQQQQQQQQQRYTSNANTTPNSSLRKVISIASFPQPPRNDSRLSSAPGSPLVPESSAASRHPPTSSRSRPPTLLTPKEPMTPTFLNGSGDRSSIPNARMSDGLISVVSPTYSRSSSAQDSYSTSATTYDDLVDDGPGIKDAKGNVIVSVRVRPDACPLAAAAAAASAGEGAFSVDPRRSLVSCSGANGGDYIYGMSAF